MTDDEIEFNRDVHFPGPVHHEGEAPRAVQQNIDERSGDQHEGRHGRVGRG